MTLVSGPAPDLERLMRTCAGDAPGILRALDQAVRAHGQVSAASLDLVASHNHMSPLAVAMLSSPVADHILSGRVGSREHSGGAWIDAVDTIVVELGKRLFGAAVVEYRPMSGATANGMALMGAIGPDAAVLAMPARYGGHRTYREGGYGGVLRLRMRDLPCDDRGDIDLDKLAEMLEQVRPEWIMVGTAEMLFPYPLAAIRKVAAGVGARIFYDGAHVLGLVAGGQFQDPLREGAALLTGSGQKTLGGPISGLVLTTDPEIGERVVRQTSGLLSNYQNNRVAALAVALAEMVAFGRPFAEQIVRNARALGAALAERGVPVMEADRDCTTSHLVLVNPGPLADGRLAFWRLEAARILTTKVPLPHTYPDRLGLRLGTPAVTRLGMREGEMRTIADLVARVIVDGEPPEDVRKQSTELARNFTTVHYGFQEVPA